MRSAWRVIIIAFLAPIVAQALDMGPLQEMLAKSKYSFIVRPKNDEGQTTNETLPAPTIELRSPGQLLYTRTEKNKKISQYQINLSAVSIVDMDLGLDIRSSTCRNLKPHTSCRMRVAVPLVQYRLDPLNGAKPAPKLLRAFNTLDMSGQIFSKYFPEIASRSYTELVCNDWSWATDGGSHSPSILEASIINENNIQDLGRPATSQFTIGKDIPCDLRNKACRLNFNNARSNYYYVIVSLVQDEGFVFETRQGNGSCTMAFRSDGRNSLREYFSDDYVPKATPDLSTPALLAKFQKRLDSNLIKEFSELQIHELLDGGVFRNEPLFYEIAFNAKFPWLKFFDLGDANGYESDSCPNGQSGACGAKILVRDRFIGGAE